MEIDELHRDRVRASSFGSVAEAYERFRPAFPEKLLDDLAAHAPRDVLDIGCGTGKVARGLMKRGVSVLGVELDERMAAVARSFGVAVEVSAFEAWEDAGRRFDLVTCGDAWHWIDPKRGIAKVEAILRPGGAFTFFFNMQLLDDDVVAALKPVYAAHAPAVPLYGRMPPLVIAMNPFTFEGPFTPVENELYETERSVSGEEWVGFMTTISDHQKLGTERLDALLTAARVALAPFGERLRVRMITSAYTLRRLAR